MKKFIFIFIHFLHMLCGLSPATVYVLYDYHSLYQESVTTARDAWWRCLGAMPRQMSLFGKAAIEMLRFSLWMLTIVKVELD